MNDLICPKHSGCVSDIEHLEEDVRALWSRWNGMQKMLIGTMVSAVLSLMGVVLLLLRSVPK